MNGPRICLASTGERGGYLIAVLPPPEGFHNGPRLVVGDVRRVSADGEPEHWKAWLWPVAGGVMHVTQNCDAAENASPVRLLDRLQKRAEKEPWWERGAT